MENIIVFVDEPAYALRELLPMRSATPTRWVVVGCPPRMSRHISRWVSHRSRVLWQDKWLTDLREQLRPALLNPSDEAIWRLSGKDLAEQTRQLRLEFGAARVLDARRPKLGQELPPVTSDQPADQHTGLGVLGSTSALGALLILTSD